MKNKLLVALIALGVVEVVTARNKGASQLQGIKPVDAARLAELEKNPHVQEFMRLRDQVKESGNKMHELKKMYPEVNEYITGERQQRRNARKEARTKVGMSKGPVLGNSENKIMPAGYKVGGNPASTLVFVRDTMPAADADLDGYNNDLLE